MKMGIQIALYPLGATYAAAKTYKTYFDHLKNKGTTKGFESGYITHDEYLELVGIDKIAEWGGKYLPPEE